MEEMEEKLKVLSNMIPDCVAISAVTGFNTNLLEKRVANALGELVEAFNQMIVKLRESIAQLEENDKQVRVVVPTMHQEVAYARRALDAGALGYVLKHSAPTELVAAVNDPMKLLFNWGGGALGERHTGRVRDLNSPERPALACLADRRHLREVGMGGRFDATNVILPHVAVVTNISLEHQEYLGYTIAEIAAEKAGIVKPGVPTWQRKVLPPANDAGTWKESVSTSVIRACWLASTLDSLTSPIT
jgi:hypothetical protein